MKFPIFILAVLVCGQAVADQKNCEAYADLARSIMDGRQNGLTMKSSMGAAENSNMDDGLKKIVKGMLIAAYERPRFSSEQMKNRAISDFEDSYYLSCVKS